jgi:rRNA-processing protein FCF1
MSNTLPKVIAVDANFLIALGHPKTSTDDNARINDFLERVQKSKVQIIVPMPAFAEYLVRADAAATLAMQTFEKRAYVRLAPFDRVAAVECARIDRLAIESGDKKDKAKDSWQKVKIDRQIISIAKANGAKMIISEDKSLRTHAHRNGISALFIRELPLPESAKQGSLSLDDGKATS